MPGHTMGGQSYGSTMPENTMGGQSFGSTMPGYSMLGTPPYRYPQHGTSGIYSRYSQYPSQPAIMSIPSSSYVTSAPFDFPATSGDPGFGGYVPHTEASVPNQFSAIPFDDRFGGLSHIGTSFDVFDTFVDAAFVSHPDMGTPASLASYTTAVNPPDIGKRVPRLSHYATSPFTNKPATTPIPARAKGKATAKPNPKGNTGISSSTVGVIVQRYRDNNLPEMELLFHPQPINKRWRGTLLGYEDDGYYPGEKNYLMSLRRADANWTIVDGEFSRKMEYPTAVRQNIDAVAGRDPNTITWTCIERVFCPILIQDKHWVLGVLCLADFRMVVYDSYNTAPSLKKLFADIMKKHWKKRLLEFMVDLGDKGLISASRKFRWEYAPKVPQQGGALGDCGP